MFRKRKPEHYFICPNCGEVIPEKSRACPECGSDEETGWADDLYPADDMFGIEPEKKKLSLFWKSTAKYGSMVIAVLIVYGLIAWFIPFGMFIGIFVAGGLVTAFLSIGRFHPSLKKQDRDLEEELLAMSGHDPERVERLVMYEWRKNPAATRTEMVQSAIDRLKWDRR